MPCLFYTNAIYNKIQVWNTLVIKFSKYKSRIETEMYIYVEKTDGQIVRIKVKKENIAEAKRYVGRLKAYSDIKSVFFDDNPKLISCNFEDKESRKLFLPV